MVRSWKFITGIFSIALLSGCGAQSNVNVQVAGAGSVSGAGLDCGEQCETVVSLPWSQTPTAVAYTLTASPIAANEFIGWGGYAAACGTNQSCTIEITPTCPDANMIAGFCLMYSAEAITVEATFTGSGGTPNPTPDPTPNPDPTPDPDPSPDPAPGPITRVDNPFLNAVWYVDPVWSAKAAAEPGGAAIANYSTAVWMDRIGAINGPGDNSAMGLKQHLDTALAQGANLFSFVVYNLPNRDCAALASNGELLIAENGYNRYVTEYIQPIMNIISNPAYSQIRIVALVEVDSLPNLVTNLDLPSCQEANGPGGYVDGIRYALQQLGTLDNVYSYVDIGHSGWLGWSDNFYAATQLIGDAVSNLGNDVNPIAGFVSNSANYTPVDEPYLPDPNLQVAGQPVRASSFYEWNDHLDERSFVTAWRNAMIQRGFPSSIGMLIDTGRNGWGGSNRPTGTSASTSLDGYVNGSRIDRRQHRGNWCNQPGGIGYPPQAAPFAGVDAYVWVKPPGESDGISNPNFTPDPNDPNKKHDGMCDPNASSTYANDPAIKTGSMPNAPHAGRWFPEQFQTLLKNAYPPLN